MEKISRVSPCVWQHRLFTVQGSPRIEFWAAGASEDGCDRIQWAFGNIWELFHEMLPWGKVDNRRTMTCERGRLGQKGIWVVQGILEKAFTAHEFDSFYSFREGCSVGRTLRWSPICPTSSLHSHKCPCTVLPTENLLAFSPLIRLCNMARWLSERKMTDMAVHRLMAWHRSKLPVLSGW